MAAVERNLYQVETVMTRNERLKAVAESVGRAHIWTEGLFRELVFSESLGLKDCLRLTASLREADLDNVETDDALMARRYL